MTDSVDGAAVAREFIRHSPFAQLVGLEVEALEADRARLRLPFKAELATTGEVVHGGAVSSLIDTAATVAACVHAVGLTLRTALSALEEASRRRRRRA